VARDRELLVNLERVRSEMDELWGAARGWSRRPRSAFTPRVDVYYCGRESPRAIVKVDLAGVSLESVGLEVVGRELVISGQRPVQETEGRVYQQLEIEAGPFRRIVELDAEVVAEEAKATYVDGILRVELPLRTGRRATRRVPIDQG
jgi:HSP20 family protein